MMKRLTYILAAVAALIVAACSQTIVFDESNEVVVPEIQVPQTHKILYTSTDGKCVSPRILNVFGAKLVSNTYQNGQGVIIFDGEVTQIGDSAFYQCFNLKSITIPESVTTMGYTPFGACSNLAEFNGKFASADKRCLVVDGVLNSFAPAGVTEYTIPNSVTSIGGDTFSSCSSLTSVTIPDSVIAIGNYAFSDCSSLTSVTIPDSVIAIGNYAFSDCSSLTSVTIGNSITSIGNRAFFDCRSLTSITIPDSVTSIGDSAFYNYGNLKDVYCKPTTPPTLGSSSVFDPYTADLMIYVPAASVKSYKTEQHWRTYADAIVADAGEVADNAKILYTSTDGNIVTPYQPDVFGANIISNTYQNDQGQIVFDGEVTKVGYDAFNGCTTLASIALPEGVTELGYRAFRGCSELTRVTLPNSITTFADHVFNACGKLESIALPKSLKKIGSYAFNNCNSLEFVHVFDIADWCNITFSNNTSTPLYYAKKLYCNGVEVTEANIPEGITAISDYAFYNCVPLTKVTIPASVTSIGGYSFQNCSNIKYVYCNPTTPPTIGSYVFMHVADGSYHYTNCTIYVPENSVTAYMSAKGWVDYADRIMSAGYANNVIRYTSTDGKVVNPYSADVFGVSIVSNTYENGQGTIVLSDNPTKFGAFAFRDCKTLATISIPTTVLEIGNSAFNNCSSLESIYIPGSVTTIGTQAFYGCNSIESVKIPDSVTSIGEIAFGFCASLSEFKGKFASSDGRCLIVDGTLNSFAQAGVTEYTLPKTVKTIGSYAMHNSAQLTTVTIPTSVTAIAEGAFNGCISLQSVYCQPTSTPTGAAGMFDNNHPNRKIYVPSTAVDAYKSAQHWSTYADAIVADVNKANCQILYTSTDGNVVTPYATDVFGANIVSNTYENGQGVITFDGEVTTIGPNAFWTRVNLASITLPQSVTSIGYYAFQGCTNLRNITIPDSVTAIDTNPFLDCKALEEFNGKFASADKLCLIVNGVLNTFAIGSGVIEYNISSDVNIVGSSSFAGCTTLTKVTIPSSTTVIRAAAFSNCSNLASIYCQPTTPPTGAERMFAGNATDRKIYVPSASVEEYKSAQHWSDYADAIVAEDGSDEPVQQPGITPGGDIAEDNYPDEL